MLKTGTRIRDGKGNKGLVSFATSSECEIKWDNGMRGSFNENQLKQNGIVEVSPAEKFFHNSDLAPVHFFD